jgi:hypothetical protein
MPLYGKRDNPVAKGPLICPIIVSIGMRNRMATMKSMTSRSEGAIGCRSLTTGWISDITQTANRPCGRQKIATGKQMGATTVARVAIQHKQKKTRRRGGSFILVFLLPTLERKTHSDAAVWGRRRVSLALLDGRLHRRLARLKGCFLHIPVGNVPVSAAQATDVGATLIPLSQPCALAGTQVRSICGSA